MTVGQYIALIARITELDKAYYIDDCSPVADSVYDNLRRQLVVWEADNPGLVRADSPTQRVGSLLDTSPLAKTKHPYPMLSLDNAFDRIDLVVWLARVHAAHPTFSHENGMVVEPKLDGMAIELVYNGRLTRGVTRGDGEIGEDITHTLLHVPSIPKSVGVCDEFVVRGEACMCSQDFERYNAALVAEGLPPKSNPRNAVAGVLRKLKANPEHLKYVQFSAFESNAPVATYAACKHNLKLHGFAYPASIPVTTVSEMLTAIHAIGERRDKPFPLDGAVIKLDEYVLRRRIGASSRSPKWMIAFKWDAEQAETTLLSVQWQLGRTGVCTPVGVFNATECGGVQITNATLHNVDHLNKLGACIGDILIIQRAGDVVPQIVSATRTERSTAIAIPTECPGCGGPVDNDGSTVRCRAARKCGSVLQAKFEHYVSRKAMNILGLGGVFLQRLIATGDVTTFSDLHRLTVDTGAAVWGSRKVADKVVQAIASTRGIAADKFLYALGIPGVGSCTAKDLIHEFGSVESVQNATRDQLLAITGIGDITADAILHYFATDEDAVECQKLLAAVNPQALTARTGNLNGSVIVFTGKFAIFPRETHKDQAEHRGAKVSNSVTSKTTLLVAGPDAGSKLAKANKLGIRVVTEQEFVDVVLKERNV